MLRTCSVIGFAWVCSLVLNGAFAAQPSSPSSSVIDVTHPYFAAGFELATTAAGYATLQNLTSTEVHITDVSVPNHIARGASLHRSVSQDNMVKMQGLPDGITLKPNAQMVLETGGYHIMLHQLSRPLEVGTEVPVTFHFEQQGEQQVTFSVRALDNGVHEHHHN